MYLFEYPYKVSTILNILFPMEKSAVEIKKYLLKDAQLYNGDVNKSVSNKPVTSNAISTGNFFSESLFLSFIKLIVQRKIILWLRMLAKEFETSIGNIETQKYCSSYNLIHQVSKRFMPN